MIEFVLGWFVGEVIALILITNGTIDRFTRYGVTHWRRVCAKLKK